MAGMNDQWYGCVRFIEERFAHGMHRSPLARAEVRTFFDTCPGRLVSAGIMLKGFVTKASTSHEDSLIKRFDVIAISATFVDEPSVLLLQEIIRGGNVRLGRVWLAFDSPGYIPTMLSQILTRNSRESETVQSITPPRWWNSPFAGTTESVRSRVKTADAPSQWKGRNRPIE
jgi:hypothetical protein